MQQLIQAPGSTWCSQVSSISLWPGWVNGKDSGESMGIWRQGEGWEEVYGWKSALFSTDLGYIPLASGFAPPCRDIKIQLVHEAQVRNICPPFSQPCACCPPDSPQASPTLIVCLKMFRMTSLNCQDTSKCMHSFWFIFPPPLSFHTHF